MADLQAGRADAGLNDLHRAAIVFSSDDLPPSQWQLEHARTYAERLDKLSGSSKPEFLTTLGSIYAKEERNADARRILTKALSLMPPVKPGQPRSGLARQVEEALDSLNKAGQ